MWRHEIMFTLYRRRGGLGEGFLGYKDAEGCEKSWAVDGNVSNIHRHAIPREDGGSIMNEEEEEAC